MSELVQTMRAATELGAPGVLRTLRSFTSALVGPDYPFLKWWNDPAVDRDESRFLGSLASRGPFLDDFQYETEEDRLVEFKYDGRGAIGLAIAYCDDDLSVSLGSDPVWDSNVIDLRVHTFLAGGGDVTTEIVPVLHASRVGHIETHTDWFDRRRLALLPDGIALASQCPVVFPCLTFCESALEQLRELRAGSSILKQVIKKLTGFDNYCVTWSNGPFDPALVPFLVSPESEATMQQYAVERTFLCPDGQRRVFEWHARLTPASWRVHFYPEAATRTIIVGYVGSHLPTTRFG